MRKVAVIGLGRFGMALARNLAAGGVQIIAMDRNGQLVNDIKDFVDIAVRLDSTDEAALVSQDIPKVDICVVSIGENFEAALLTTVLLKRLGVTEIICRAQSATHAEIFRQVGAHRVIQPEEESGSNLARQLSSPHLVDFIRLADGFSLMEVKSPSLFVGKSIRDLALRNQYGLNLVVIRRPLPQEEGQSARFQTVVPLPDHIVAAGDLLVFVGTDASLARLPRE